MALITETYASPTFTATTVAALVAELNAAFPDLATFLATLKNTANSMNDANVVSDAGIQLSKIANGTLITAHASRHASGGADPLGAGSVSGAMIQPRSINASHIGIGAVLAEHLGFDSLMSDLMYIDAAPLTASDGATISKPDGYEYFTVIVQGYSCASTPSDAGANQVIFYVSGGGDTYTVTAKTISEDGDTKTGSIYYVRLAWN